MTMAIRPPSNQPAWVRWSGPNANLGEVVYTTHFFGYVPFEGVRLPMGYTTKLDWRDVDLLKLYVDNYLVDTADRRPGGAGQSRRRTAGPRRRARWRSRWRRRVQVTPIARGLWRITGGTMVIEFADHMTLFEVGGGAERVAAVIKAARQIVPAQAGDRGDRLASSLRSHCRPAAGRRRRADGHLPARQRRDLQGDDVAADAELP